MAYGDSQRTWFPEMIQKLRLEWHESMTFPDLIALSNSLDSMLHEIRSTRNIRSPIGLPGHMGCVAEPSGALYHF